MKRNSSFLYTLLPQFIQRNDADSGHVLRRLLSVVQGEMDGFEHQIEALYDSWFIETCPDDRLHYIAALVGVELDHVMPILPSHRRLIANALEYRREKGTLSGLQSVLADASGWSVEVAEEADWLAMTPSLKTADRPNHTDVDLRHGLTVEDAARTVDLRPSSAHDDDDAGTLRRLVITVDRRTRAPITHGEMARMSTGRYTMSPLRINTPLFQRTLPSMSVLQSDGHMLTNTLLATDLHDSLALLRGLSGAVPEDTQLWGRDKSLCLWLHDRPLLPTQVQVEDLSTWTQPGPFTVALVGKPVEPLTASRPELQLSMTGSRKRILKLDRKPANATEAAELLQRAIRKGVKDSRARGCRVMVAADRLVVALDGHHPELLFEFGPSPSDDSTCSQLGVNLVDSTEALVLVSKEVELRGHTGFPFHGYLHRDGASPVSIQCTVASTVEETAASLHGALQAIGPWTVQSHDGRIVIIPPVDGTAREPFQLHAEPSSQLTLAALGLETIVCVDAEHGRVALPIGVRGPVYADWISGFDSITGSTPMARSLTGPAESDWCARVGRQYGSRGHQPGCYATIEAAVEAWNSTDRNGYIRIEDNGLYGQGRGPLSVDLRGRSLRLEAEASGHPCIARTLRVRGDHGSLFLSGLSISGGLSVGGNLKLRLLHCTVANAIIAEQSGEFEVALDHSMCGPIMLPDTHCTLSLTDSIVNGGGDPAVSGLDPDLDLGPSITMTRTTLYGDTRVQSVHHGLDTLVVGHLYVEDTQTGLLDHCAYHHDSRVPRTIASQLLETDTTTDRSAAIRLEMRTIDMGQPGYMRASLSAPNPLEASASNGGEIGVYNALFDNRRMHMLKRMLSEFLPLGWTARIQISQ